MTISKCQSHRISPSPKTQSRLHLVELQPKGRHVCFTVAYDPITERFDIGIKYLVGFSLNPELVIHLCGLR